MNTLTKLALGAMGRLRPKPSQGDAAPKIALPAPDKTGGMPLMEALSKRATARSFDTASITPQELSDLLWASFGVNRPDGK